MCVAAPTDVVTTLPHWTTLVASLWGVHIGMLGKYVLLGIHKSPTLFLPPPHRVLITTLFLLCVCGCIGCCGYGYRRQYLVRRTVHHPAHMVQPVVVTSHTSNSSQGIQPGDRNSLFRANMFEEILTFKGRPSKLAISGLPTEY